MQAARRLIAVENPPQAHVRPLAIGAAWLTTEFEALAPAHWGAALVLAQLFKSCDMERAGWDENTTVLDDMGAYQGTRRWRVVRYG